MYAPFRARAELTITGTVTNYDALRREGVVRLMTRAEQAALRKPKEDKRKLEKGLLSVEFCFGTHEVNFEYKPGTVIEPDIILAHADTLSEGNCGAVTVKIGKIKTKMTVTSSVVSPL